MKPPRAPLRIVAIQQMRKNLAKLIERRCYTEAEAIQVRASMQRRNRPRRRP